MARPKKYDKRILLPLEQQDYDRLVSIWLNGGPVIVEQIRQAIADYIGANQKT